MVDDPRGPRLVFFVSQVELGLDNDARHSNNEIDDEWRICHFIMARCSEPEVFYEVGEEREEVMRCDLMAFNEIFQ